MPTPYRVETQPAESKGIVGWAHRQFARIAEVFATPVVHDHGTKSANYPFDPNVADHHLLTLGASITLTLSTVAVPNRTTVRLYLTQDGTGSRLVTWSGVTWISGITPTLQTAAASLDVFEFTFRQTLGGTNTWLGRQLGKNINANTTGTAGSVIAALTAGAYLTSSGTYNGSTARTFDVDRQHSEAVVSLVPSTSGSVTLEAASDTLRETRIGRLVHVCGRLIVASVSAPVGDLRVTGLTHTVGAGESAYAAVSVRGGGLAAGATTQLQGYADPGQTRLVIEKYAAGGAAPLAGDVQAGTSLIIDCTYTKDL
jgi:hypothetical protein